MAKTSGESRALDRARVWPGVLEMWLDTKDSDRTRREYTKIVEEAMAGLEDFDRITPQNLARYRGRLLERVEVGTLSPASAAVRLIALRGFLNFARVAGRCAIPRDAIDVLLKSPSVDTRRPYTIAEPEEIEALIEACHSARDRALIRLTVETGLRCAELLALRLQDFRTTETGVFYVYVRHGKGKKSREVPLSRKARECVETYLAEAGRALGQSSAILFQSREGDGRLDTSRFRQILIEARRAAGISKAISPHSLRHTAAMRWLRASGRDLNAVRRLLGHTSLETTKRYVDHLSLEELARVVDEL